MSRRWRPPNCPPWPHRAALDSAMRVLGSSLGEEPPATSAEAAAAAEAAAEGSATPAAAGPSADGHVGVLALTWEEIQAEGGTALSLYGAGALLRERSLGEGARFDDDEGALHLLLPTSAEDARGARAGAARAKLRGRVLGVCLLLVPDGEGESGGGARIGTIEQLAVPREVEPEARARCALALIEGAVEEASARRLAALVAPPRNGVLRGAPEEEGEEEEEWKRWLAAAGFGRAGPEIQAEVAVAPGALCRVLGG